jgi:hypothetical protein
MPSPLPPRDPVCPLTEVWTFSTLLAHIRSIIEANDRRYLEMFGASDKATSTAMIAAEKAIAAAMAAAEKAVVSALAAADKAVGKAEESQLRVNVSQNEFRQQLKDQAATFVTKESLEAVDQRIGVISNTFVTKEALDALDKRIQLLERQGSAQVAIVDSKGTDRAQNNWFIGVVVAGALAAAAVVISLLAFLKQH